MLSALVSRPVVIGVSLKMYFGHAQGRQWLARVADIARGRSEILNGTVELFVIPGYLQIPAALDAFAGTPVRVGAQDVAVEDRGPYTGEVSAAELAEIGATVVEVGHAERRRLFGDTDLIVAAKLAAAIRDGLTPVLCVGETTRVSTAVAVAIVERQLRSALATAAAGAVIVAYEPATAIGATMPADTSHIAVVVDALRARLSEFPGRGGSTVVYGGSAGPGLMTELGNRVDGLFLGRLAHDPAALEQVLDEAALRPRS